MPELPEVQTIAADLDELAAGRIIEAAAVRYPKIVAGEADRFIAILVRARIERVERLGKWIRFFLEGRAGPAALLVHLKMTGQFQAGPWPAGDDLWPAHAHAAFRLSGLPPAANTLLYFDMRKFGRLRAFDQPDLEPFLAGLAQGPDPLTVSAEEFFSRLTRRRGRLKSVLLDQSTIAGLGNIYVDEGLFAAGLSPLRPASSLTRPETDRLLAETRAILAASIAARGSTTRNYAGLKGGGSFQRRHRVYGHTGQPCPVCGAAIERLVVGGRSTHYCPHCQKT
ncbi:MAG: bifunctional DNA-formamidopyrimidine glycosylase/DNA-(apurinic or apyrimidinic site) lyase [Candidatus Adiutrix sp.]|jgi:formamidopyrimidine-DNA glycosylase|nr:bifunctional DNA-formamidopyrimidine glycosylase/DNA-(apurinic or apyrimidinic site) lyase [Candidatus Adiutrix sp.]